jgi:transglycosylase-like protein with SLT domain
MVNVRLLIIFLLAGQVAIATAAADERTTLREPAALNGQKDAGQHATKDAKMTAATPFDRIATAVDGAESSHGKDLGMWRPDPSGPQGPMQVSEAAATDVGGGDRLDLTQNRAIGRAYLAQLYGRYRNWPDAIAAYNWGIGKMDAWVKVGRPPDRFLVGVATYMRRVLHDSGLCNGTRPNRLGQPPRPADRSDAFAATRDASTNSICAHFYNGRFSNDRHKASMVAPELAAEQPRSTFEREAASARLSWVTAMRGLSQCTITSGDSLRCR